MKELAPIALFVYSRLWHTQQTVNSLLKNKLAAQSDLVIFCDGPKNNEQKPKVDEVKQYARSITGFKSVKIYESETNKGLANSIIEGVTRVVNEYGKIIVLEDDLILSEYFLDYMNDALVCYEKEDKVISIHGYCYPLKENLPETFLLKGADCWGWATWKRGWDLFEKDSKKLKSILIEQKLAYKFELNGTVANMRMLNNQINGKVDSWAIRWHASAIINNKLTLYPGKSLVTNIGADGQGTHTKKTDDYLTEVYNKPLRVGNIPIEENSLAFKAFGKYFISIKPNFIKILAKKVLRNLYYKHP